MLHGFTIMLYKLDCKAGVLKQSKFKVCQGSVKTARCAALCVPAPTATLQSAVPNIILDLPPRVSLYQPADHKRPVGRSLWTVAAVQPPSNTICSGNTQSRTNITKFWIEWSGIITPVSSSSPVRHLHYYSILK